MTTTETITRIHTALLAARTPTIAEAAASYKKTVAERNLHAAALHYSALLAELDAEHAAQPLTYTGTHRHTAH